MSELTREDLRADLEIHIAPVIQRVRAVDEKVDQCLETQKAHGKKLDHVERRVNEHATMLARIEGREAGRREMKDRWGVESVPPGMMPRLNGRRRDAAMVAGGGGVLGLLWLIVEFLQRMLDVSP